MNREPSYTEEHAQVVRKIKRNSDYYEILGVGKSCSVEEVKKAYRKLSLKVHPDKNKAPGSEEAFKKVSKAFKCLSDDNSRRQYDQTGLVEGDEYSQQYNGMRQRRTGHNVLMIILMLMKSLGRFLVKVICFVQLMCIEPDKRQQVVSLLVLMVVMAAMVLI
ncbi:hypothetical protein R6Q59_021807 [Mikania micrantha]